MITESGVQRVAARIDHRPVSARQWLTIALCGLVMLFDGFDIQSISFMTPYIARDWHLSRAMLGPIFGVVSGADGRLSAALAAFRSLRS